MRGTEWIDWCRTDLQPHERDDLLAALTSEQKKRLVEHDYVWVKGTGVLWNPPDGALRRARFTHGTHFRTERGEFYIDSEGSVREPLRAETPEGEATDETETVARPNPREARRGRGEDQGRTLHP
jgi:hypothetical protein